MAKSKPRKGARAIAFFADPVLHASLEEAVRQGEAACVSALVRERVRLFPQIVTMLNQLEKTGLALERSTEVLRMAVEIIKNDRMQHVPASNRTTAEQEIVAH